MASLALHGTLVSLALVLGACSAPLAPGADSVMRDAAEGASTAALIVVERTVSADESARGSAVARFLKMRSGSVDEEALRMVGATLDLPPVGSCGHTSAAADSADTPRALELLDVGSLVVEASGAKTSLEARSLPDISDLVTGVLYAARAVDVDGFPARGAYSIQSSGSSLAADIDHAIPAFTVAATAPGEPDGLRVDGQDATVADGLVLRAGERADLTWRVSDAADGDDTDDVVYVEILSASDGSGPAVRCLFADRGAASIPASAFELDRGTLVVHRVHHETFQVRAGIDSGVIRFDFARAAEFVRR